MTFTALRIQDKNPTLVSVETPPNAADLVEIDVQSASICGSDLHMIDMGFVEGRVIGHEFAGYTSDGTAVAIEPIGSCGACAFCDDGERQHCSAGKDMIGISTDGGMAQKAWVPAASIVPLPTGLDVSIASLVEPLAVAEHGVNRANITSDDRVLIIGAGAVGLATVAALSARGVSAEVVARHDHQAAAVEQLGGTLAEVGDGYDVVVDAVGSAETVQQAVRRLRPTGRLAMLGVFWEPVPIDMTMLMKEISIIPAMMYGGNGPQRELSVAAAMLAADPGIADALITHRFPLDGADAAFATARNRSAGSIKVIFEPGK